MSLFNLFDLRPWFTTLFVNTGFKLLALIPTNALRVIVVSNFFHFIGSPLIYNYLT